MFIYGKQIVLEALATMPLKRVFVAQGINQSTAQQVRSAARKVGIEVEILPRIQLDQATKTTKHQGVVAETANLAFSDIAAAHSLAEERGEAPFFILLDQITDPRNYGAIIRSAEALGAHAVVTEERRSAQLNAVVMKASAGAAAHLPLVQVKNLPRFIDEIKKDHFWVYGAAADAFKTAEEQNFSGKVALVIGSEGSGMRRLVQEKCDELIHIPMRGQLASLNASVAAGILMYEVMRGRK